MPAGTQNALQLSLPVSALPSSGSVDRHDGATGPLSRRRKPKGEGRASKNYGYSGIGLRQRSAGGGDAPFPERPLRCCQVSPRHLICSPPDLACVLTIASWPVTIRGTEVNTERYQS